MSEGVRRLPSKLAESEPLLEESLVSPEELMQMEINQNLSPTEKKGKVGLIWYTQHEHWGVTSQNE